MVGPPSMGGAKPPRGRARRSPGAAWLESLTPFGTPSGRITQLGDGDLPPAQPRPERRRAGQRGGLHGSLRGRRQRGLCPALSTALAAPVWLSAATHAGPASGRGFGASDVFQGTPSAFGVLHRLARVALALGHRAPLVSRSQAAPESAARGFDG